MVRQGVGSFRLIAAALVLAGALLLDSPASSWASTSLHQSHRDDTTVAAPAEQADDSSDGCCPAQAQLRPSRGDRRQAVADHLPPARVVLASHLSGHNPIPIRRPKLPSPFDPFGLG